MMEGELTYYGEGEVVGPGKQWMWNSNNNKKTVEKNGF